MRCFGLSASIFAGIGLILPASTAQAGVGTTDALASSCRSGSATACSSLWKDHWPEIANKWEEIARKACDHGDQSTCQFLLTNSPLHALSHWKDLGSPVAVAPSELIDFIRLDNRVDGYSEIPHAPSPEAATEAVEKLRSALVSLPLRVTQTVQGRVVAVFLLEGLGGTGYQLDLYTENDQPAGGILAFDVGMLKRKANDWASWKENTAFRRGGQGSTEPPDLKVEIEDKKNDTELGALQYILLHEIGHVIERMNGLNPLGWDFPSPERVLEFPFLRLTWTTASGQYVSKFDAVFPERRKLRFYASDPKQQLPLEDAPAVYAHLAQTSFATLYAATGPRDDFAESFANYVHTEVMGKPFRISLSRAGKEIAHYGPCWSEVRCREKRKQIEQILGPAPAK